MLNNEDICNLLGLDFKNISNTSSGFILINLWICKVKKFMQS
jgi:hypothetical protein